MNKNVLMAIVLVVGLGAGFFGGMEYQKGKSGSQFLVTGANGQGQFRRTGNGANNIGGGMNNFRATLGSIISADNTSITVKMQDGSSKIVLLTDKTSIGKSDEATKQDLSVGQTVQVLGTNNSDGSITAQNIQLNPIVRQPSQGQIKQ